MLWTPGEFWSAVELLDDGLSSENARKHES